MNWRSIALPVIAVALVAAVLGVQLASGGRDFVPSTPPSSACVTDPPPLPEQGDLDALTQTIVIDGVRRAACTLKTGREQLLVALPSPEDRAELARTLGVSDAELLGALRTGLLESVARLERAGALPPVSTLADDLISRLGLPAIAEAAARQIPDDVIDDLLPTGPVLRRAVTTVDLARVLDGIGDASSLEDALAPAIRDAALAEARERIVERLRSLVGFG